ncbi:macro domain-containing protein [Gramella sp. GC03-9]|uniref:Macro domain-containing protein n=1 Tax=Christiangramia oceanisediminis TaxID=2920386 RepID=A0A9X2I9T9_9FLAO|nr:macro domain-containing protein [Gramella oceanisediminis]MCP9199403.1 macro domain-containing protein [Gramella oceanisediminis]
MKVELQNIEIEIVKGDISNQPDLDAVVNAANAELAPGGGVAGAIHKAAGPELYEECKSLAPIAPGEAVITRAYGLPNQFVIHTLGPVYGKDKPEDQLLSNCYRNSLKRSEEKKLGSIGFPGISTGIFGYPKEDAVSVVFSTLVTELPNLEHLKKLRFVVFSDADRELYESKLKEVAVG